MLRKIIHIDMDSFFASVEQRDFPQYRGRPLAVGGRSPRSVVAAASYEAREFGVRSAMPMAAALRKCPDLVVVPHRFDVYQAVSRVLHDIFHEYTDLVEPLSLDEAFLDVTEPKKGPDSASLIAKEIKAKIKERTLLTASAGVSYNKFLAKIASDMDKPDGFFLIRPEEAQTFLDDLDIGLFFGVGKRTEEKMKQMNIHKGRDLRRLARETCIQHFGKAGAFFYDVVRGIDERPVTPYRERKSIGAERTFEEDVHGYKELLSKLFSILQIAWQRCEGKEKIGKTLTMKLRFSDFTTITRSRTMDHFYTLVEARETLAELLKEVEASEKGVRLLGATFSHFDEKNSPEFEQMEFEFQKQSDFTAQ